MEFIPTRIRDVIIIKPVVHGDHRGFFMESWKKKQFTESGIDVEFVQDNHSLSTQGTLRGLHYQISHPQGQLVKVVAGKVFDVAVDIRKTSPTFGQWVGEYLSADNKHMLWMPRGFAHGFYVVSNSAEILYKCTDYYFPEFERTIAWNDPDLSIDWPLLKTLPPVLSGKDAEGNFFRDAEVFS